MSVEPQDVFFLESSIPEGAASLESILCTEELRRRPSRPPDYEKENRALVALARAMVDSNSNILQTFADTILEVTQCDSAGLSLLAKDGGNRFYWPAIAGLWKPHAGGGTPRNFGPGGDVLDRNCTLLFRHFERRYRYLQPVTPAAEECLMIPFYVGGKAVGTIWAITHNDRRKFDAEDERVMTALGQFASLAYQTVGSIEDLRAQVIAREKAETALLELARGLEAKIQRLVDANVIGIVIFHLDGSITQANEAFLRIVQYDCEDFGTGRVRWTDLTPAEWRDRDERAIAELKATGILQPYEKEYFRKDGSRAPILLGGALFEKAGNEGVAFVLDLSGEKHAEGALRRVEQQARSIVETALDAVVSMDADGIITDWNKQAEDIFGWPRSEALGRRMSETVIPVRYRPSHERGLQRFLDTGEGPILNKRIEISALRRDGEEFSVELAVTPLKSGDTCEQRLKQLAIDLPAPPEPFGIYAEAVQTGNLLFLTGMLPTEGRAAKFTGRVGAELDVEAGRRAARLAALNALAVARQHLGSLDKVTRIIRLGVSVATSGDVRDQPKVADGASELLQDVFGKEKNPSRLVYGMASLPFGASVALEVIFEVAG